MTPALGADKPVDVEAQWTKKHGKSHVRLQKPTTWTVGTMRRYL